MIRRTRALAASALALFALCASTICVASAQSPVDEPEPTRATYTAVLRGGAGVPLTDGHAIAIALIDVESRHADLGGGWDGAMGFQFGRRPLLTMTKTSRDAAVTAFDTGGFILAETMRFARTSRSAEVAIVGRIGATRVDAGPVHVRNDIGDWALLFDASGELRWYGRGGRPSRQTPALDPLAHAWLGVRHDQRFFRGGDLAPFDDPTARIVAGVMVTPIRSGESRFTVSGGFELETAMRGPARLPSGCRALLTGNLRLRR